MQNIKTNLLHKFIFIFIFSLFLPVFTNAQVIITEVMYNAEGSDIGKEWIEIYNSGGETVNLSGWKLFENDTNHKINPEEEGGSLDLPADSFGIIIDNVSKFKENHSTFNGLVFDSAFSLTNAGEILVLRDSDLNDIDSINYNSDQGANGDGNSLQIVDGDWVSASPTIGGSNYSSYQNTDEENEENGEYNSSDDLEEITLNSFIEHKIYAGAGENRNVIVGADSMFEGFALGFNKEPLQNARYIWSFGDGISGEGKNILHNYNYPGEYVVVLNVSSGEYSASDRIIAEALPADIIISAVDIVNNFIEIHNKSSYELNLSWWRIKSGNEFFTLPKDTIILSNKKIKFSPQTIGLGINDVNQIYLLYPNGSVAYYYDPYVLKEVTYIVEPKAQRVENSISSSSRAEPSDPVLGLLEQTNLIQTEQNQLALVSNPTNSIQTERNLVNKWTLSLGSLILISMAGILFIKDPKQDFSKEKDDLDPDDFKIIE